MGYDVIVVGARCAGSPTAMLLARKGCKVLVVDKAAFPSDTISTHLVHPLAGTSVPNYFRKPYGPGWALVGDADYNRDFITAMGIMDAFLSAELCAEALDRSLSGARP